MYLFWHIRVSNPLDFVYLKIRGTLIIPANNKYHDGLYC